MHVNELEPAVFDRKDPSYFAGNDVGAYGDAGSTYIILEVARNAATKIGQAVGVFEATVVTEQLWGQELEPELDLDFDSRPPPPERDAFGKIKDISADISKMPRIKDETQGAVRMVANAILPMSPSESGPPRKIWRAVIRNKKPTVAQISQEAKEPEHVVSALLRDFKELVSFERDPQTEKETVDMPLVRKYIDEALEGGLDKFGYFEEDRLYVEEKLVLLNLLPANTAMNEDFTEDIATAAD